MTRKDFEQSPATATLANRFANRAQRAGHVSEQRPTPAAAAPASKMTTRSWYLPKETADALTNAAEHIRRTVPAVSKHEALAALLAYAVEHQADVVDALTTARADQTT